MSASHEPATDVTPYPPSVLNRLFYAVERLPLGGWWVYPLSFVALVVYHNVSLWLVGSRPFGSWSFDGLVGLFYGPYMLFSAHYLTRVAGGAIARFRPASGLSDAEYARRRYELTTMPAGSLWIPLGIGIVFAIGSILSAPLEAIAPYGGSRSGALVVFGPAAVFGYGMGGIIAWQIIRQLRQVDALHRNATALDLFDTSPIYAFSRLTVQIGLGTVFTAYFTMIANSAFQAGNAFSLGSIAVAIGFGAVSFVLPLWGIHERLVAEKAELVRGVNLRAQTIQDELYRRVDALDLVHVENVTDAITGVDATRDRIDRLRTWPWPPEVLRGFVTAVLLPVVVFVITSFVGTQLR